MDIDRIMTRLNPLIVRLLESSCHGVLSRGLLVLHVCGVRSGKRYKIPVGYQRQGDVIKVLVSKARRKNWWRNYRTANTLSVTVKGKVLTGQACLVDKNSDEFKRFVAATFARVPGLSKQFGITYVKGNEISDTDWEVVKHDAEMVTIVL